MTASLGENVLETREETGEIILTVARDRIEEVLRTLRDEHDYQQLMEIAGVDYPDRVERFDVVYMLLSLTRNHRIMVKLSASESAPVPTVTTLWPVAGWLEREVFDMYGVIFAGNPDLRRILTDYGFEGHPFRKDFPLTGYVEMRYSEEDKRVVYEPVRLTQDFRSFDFMSPWEGAGYVLPGDEKVADPSQKSAQPGPPPITEPKTTETSNQSGAGDKNNAKAEEKVAPSATAGGTSAGQGHGEPTPRPVDVAEPGPPDPTAKRPDRPVDGVSASKRGAGSAPEGS